MSRQESESGDLKQDDSIDNSSSDRHDVYSSIELVTSCESEVQEGIAEAVEDDLLNGASCVSQDDDYIISVLSNDADAGYVVEDGQHVTDARGHLGQGFIDSKDLNADASLEVIQQPAFILNLPYPVGEFL
jgi:hypothetical protein